MWARAIFMGYQPANAASGSHLFFGYVLYLSQNYFQGKRNGNN